MKQKQPTTLPKQKKAQSYTRKQALGVLHRLYVEKYVPLAAFDERLYHEVYNAFAVLAHAIHGEPKGPRYAPLLCDSCHERYYQHWVQIPHASFPSITHSLNCCTACKDRLLAEGKVLTVDNRPITPQGILAEEKELPTDDIANEAQSATDSDIPQIEEDMPQ